MVWVFLSVIASESVFNSSGWLKLQVRPSSVLVSPLQRHFLFSVFIQLTVKPSNHMETEADFIDKYSSWINKFPLKHLRRRIIWSFIRLREAGKRLPVSWLLSLIEWGLFSPFQVFSKGWHCSALWGLFCLCSTCGGLEHSLNWSSRLVISLNIEQRGRGRMLMHNCDK